MTDGPGISHAPATLQLQVHVTWSGGEAGGALLTSSDSSGGTDSPSGAAIVLPFSGNVNSCQLAVVLSVEPGRVEPPRVSALGLPHREQPVEIREQREPERIVERDVRVDYSAAEIDESGFVVIALEELTETVVGR